MDYQQHTHKCLSYIDHNYIDQGNQIWYCFLLNIALEYFILPLSYLLDHIVKTLSRSFHINTTAGILHLN